jgi:adenylosuccinate synthase
MKNKAGFSDVLVGLQYGDEGKAKVIDLLADRYDVIARFNGGANAGHTIDTVHGRIALQQLPSGVFHPKTKLYIGSGCAINLWKLAEEIQNVEKMGVSLEGRLFISARAALVQPLHLFLDRINGKYIGTTNNGIGPCYADRAMRMRDGRRVNLQLLDVLRDPAKVCQEMLEVTELELKHFPVESLDFTNTFQSMLSSFPALAEKILKYITVDPLFLTKLVTNGAKVLFEGAQSIMLDVVHGDQPFVTSSHTIPGYAYVGGDLSPHYHRQTIGVAKAVMSRVGQGPFPSELGGNMSAEYCADASMSGKGRRNEEAHEYNPSDLLKSKDMFKLGIALRMLTNEYGTGTGRPRRVGLLDMNQLKEAISVYGADVLFLNKCDCLSLFSETVFAGIPFLEANSKDISDRNTLKFFPAFSMAEIKGTSPDKLPDSLMQIKNYIEQETGARLLGIGVGPGREERVNFFEWSV